MMENAPQDNDEIRQHPGCTDTARWEGNLPEHTTS